MELNTNFEELEEGVCITLYPNETNPMHKKPVRETYSNGYFFCHDSDGLEGPDYYLGDVLIYNHGYTY